MDLFYFDIETISKYKNYTDFVLLDEIGANIFKRKYEKTEWKNKYESVDDCYLNTGGISPTYGKIVCISCGYFDNGEKRISSIYSDNEIDVINKFNELLLKIEKKNFKVSGYKILTFDIPYFLHKCHSHNITPASIILTYQKKPWETRIIDIADDIKGKMTYNFSLEELCYEFGVLNPKSILDGSKVSETYWNGGLEKIKEYCEMDIYATMDISKIIYNL